MTKLNLPNQALVLVCDGRKALFLRNLGDEIYPNLRVEQAMADPVQGRTADLGTDRPGRTLDRASGRHSSVEQTDWHQLAEDRFAHDVAALLDRHDKDGTIDHLIVVAPPRTLAELRATITPRLRGKIAAELHKDLTHHPVHEIERLLTAD